MGSIIMKKHNSSNDGEGSLVDLAVIGLAFEFPNGANSVDSFWKMIKEGRCASVDFPADRLNVDAFYHPDENRPSTIPLRRGHFIERDLGAFDCPFFSITPAEAACMDPQHRMTLEVAYHALEDAGIPIQSLSGSDTSVYTGCFTNDYLSILQQDYEGEQRHAAMGSAPSMLANRLSWFFNLKGTSMNLDSACSSSLLALHLACQDLRAGTASAALVGGANLVFHPNFMKMMTDFNFLSKDGRCWSFDQNANGYARGEGISVIVVKRLSDALRDGNTIRCIIRNTGSNQDGRTPGITQPSQSAQVELIQRTFEQGNLDMGPTRFFEAHGTGTPVGDPIEANAIGEAFRNARTPEDPLYIGAVKANIGHLEGCSGLAGLIKAILVLEHGEIPPIAGFRELNGQIYADRLRICFPKETTPWPMSTIRRACVNSFGFGGTNALAILDDAKYYLEHRGFRGYHRTQAIGSQKTTITCQKNSSSIPSILSSLEQHSLSTKRYEQRDVSGIGATKLLVWSASEEKSLKALSSAYATYCSQDTIDFDDLAYSLATKRSHFAWRVCTVVGQTKPTTLDSIAPTTPVKVTKNPQVSFIFTGQGAQYAGMGQELIVYTAFRESLALSEEYLKHLDCWWSSSCSILDKLADDSSIHKAENSQTLTTCLQIALVDLFTSLGISPRVVIGHSSGEIAAAYASGALSHYSAVRVAYHRGRLASSLAEGRTDLGMMAVGLSRKEAETYLDRLGTVYDPVLVAIGCVNSPRSITLTGNITQLQTVETWCSEASIFARRLSVPLAYHSQFMSAIAEMYADSITGLEPRQNSNWVPMISSVTQDFISSASLLSAEYWVRNLTSTVEFDGACAKIMAPPKRRPAKKLGQRATGGLAITHLIEIGPHSALKGPIRDMLQVRNGPKKPKYISSLVRKTDAAVSFLEALGSLYCAGYPVDILGANLLGDCQRKMPPNLPRYPFNHSQSYWVEGRLSRNFRFREKPRHDLIGTRNLDWNPLAAQWRNVLRIAEVPWLQDHKMAGEVFFPAAGMVAMAIEALKDIDANPNSILGVQINKTSFTHPIRFGDTASAEIQLSLTQPVSGKSQDSWVQFRLFAIEKEHYLECCNGFIRFVKDIREHRNMARGPAFINGGTLVSWVKATSLACSDPPLDPYGMTSEKGLQYGPAFQNMQHLRLGCDGQAFAEVDTTSWKISGQVVHAPEYVIHPATLDGLIQLLVPGISHNEPDLATMMPSHVSGIWIDYRNSSTASGVIQAAAKCRLRGYRGATANIVGLNSDDKPVIYVEGVETTFIETKHSLTEDQSKPRMLCTQISSEPDIDLLSGQAVYEVCTRGRPKEANLSTEAYPLLEAIIISVINESLSSASQETLITTEPHLTSFRNWMQYQQERIQGGCLSAATHCAIVQLTDRVSLERVMNDVEKIGPECRFFIQIARNFLDILSGQCDPLQLMFESGLADGYYEAVLANDYYSFPASAYVDLLSFKNPSLNILEIGAGTGGQTKRLLEAMNKGGIERWRHYDYTDISAAFFGPAQSKFSQFADSMDFRLCDISKDPTLQSFQPSSYDLVIASHVLHATPKIAQSLRHIRKLLKPGGTLLLFEITQPDAIHIGFAFGLLKGWWAPLDHERRSKHSPCLTASEWNESLKNSGFSGVDVEIPGQENPEYQYSSLIISKAVEPQVSLSNNPVKVAVVLADHRPQCQILISRALKKHSIPCTVYTLTEISQTELPDRTVMVSLLEIDNYFLHGINRHDFQCLKTTILKERPIVWVTKTAQGTLDPHHHLSRGLGRVLMSEAATRKFITICLDDFDPDPTKIANAILGCIHRVLDCDVESLEDNYVARSGELHISRLSENATLNHEIAKSSKPKQKKERKLHDRPPIILQLESAGDISSLKWVQHDIHHGLGVEDDEILVEVRAIGLTQRDHMILNGQLHEQGFGNDCAGIVRAGGAKCGFQPGDPVCLIGSRYSQTLLRVKAQSATLIPPAMSFSDAATVPTALWLSYHVLVNVCRLRTGNRLLIYRGASCFGQLAIQIARVLGCKIFTTVNSESKAGFLRNLTNNDGISVILDNDNDLLSSEAGNILRPMTFNAIVGPLLGSKVDFSTLLVPGGQIVDISLKRDEEFPVSLFGGSRNISRTTVDMMAFMEENRLATFKIFREAMRMFLREEFICPRSMHPFGAGEVGAAFQHFHDRASFGRRVIELDPEATITVEVESRPNFDFDPKATYIIAGGFGGLGRNLATWIASRGARNIVLLSRSGPQTAAAMAVLDDLGRMGVHVVTPNLDIADLEKVRCEIKNLATSMPPIKGCIQATMALRDNLFENMTHEDWDMSTRPKVTGSWNLHEALPADMDFFVMISSVNSIVGGRGTANYAAGNSFMDALAHHRVSLGQKAVSINLGMVVSDGVLAENQSLLQATKRVGIFMDLHMKDLTDLLGYYCDPNLPVLPRVDAQVVVGLELPQIIMAKGIDIHHSIRRPLFRNMFRVVPEELCRQSGQGVAGAMVDRATALRQAKSQDEAELLVTEWVASKIAQVLGVPESEIDPEKPLHTYGMDSLVAIDLKNWFDRDVGATVEVFTLLGNVPLGDLSREVARSRLARQDSRVDCVT